MAVEEAILFVFAECLRNQKEKDDTKKFIVPRV